MTDWDAMARELSRLTVRELRKVARDEGICLGYDGSRKAMALQAIVAWRRHREENGDDD